MPAGGKPDLSWEIFLGYPKLRIAGVDEVGRGCLAGPVVAGAVILPPQIDFAAAPWVTEIKDSKTVSPETRRKLAPLIESWALASSIGVASVEEIDEINIYHAAHLAMRRAVEGLKVAPERIIVDGNAIPKSLPCEAVPVVKGDLVCLSIAAASIIAKVWRDRLMAELDQRYPGYGLAGHKGYPTPEHSTALRKLGPCDIHRKSFEPVMRAFSPER